MNEVSYLKKFMINKKRLKKLKIKLEETTETTNQEASQEPENVTTEVLTDSNGISYSLDDSEAPNTVDIKNKVYSVGSKFNVAESPKTVQRIEVVTDDETDFSAVMVTIKDDATGKEDTYYCKRTCRYGLLPKFETKFKLNLMLFINTL